MYFLQLSNVAVPIISTSLLQTNPINRVHASYVHLRLPGFALSSKESARCLFLVNLSLITDYVRSAKSPCPPLPRAGFLPYTPKGAGPCNVQSANVNLSSF